MGPPRLQNCPHPLVPSHTARCTMEPSGAGPTKQHPHTVRASRTGRQRGSTVVDIDSVRRQQDRGGHLEAAAQEDGLKSLGPLEWLLMVLVLSLVLLLLPLSIWFCVRVVREHQRAVVFRLGHLLRGRPRGPGLLFFLPVLDVCHIVDIRLKTLKIPLHTVLTQDLHRAELSAVCLYRIENVALSCSALVSVESTLECVVQAVIRDVLSQQRLSLLPAQRRTLGQKIQKNSDALLGQWGIRLEKTDIEELSFPLELQRRPGADTQTSFRPGLEPQVTAAESDLWDGLRSSLRLLRPALVLPLSPDLLSATSDPSPPVSVETGQGSTQPNSQDSPMM